MKQAGLWEPAERDILGGEGLRIGDWPAGTRSISRKGNLSALASSSPAGPSCTPMSCLAGLGACCSSWPLPTFKYSFLSSAGPSAYLPLLGKRRWKMAEAGFGR